MIVTEAALLPGRFTLVLFLALRALPPGPLGEEAVLLPGSNYQEGALPTAKAPLGRCVWSQGCWEGHLPGVGSSWWGSDSPPTGSGESRLPLPARSRSAVGEELLWSRRAFLLPLSSLEGEVGQPVPSGTVLVLRGPGLLLVSAVRNKGREGAFLDMLVPEEWGVNLVGRAEGPQAPQGASYLTCAVSPRRPAELKSVC